MQRQHLTQALTEQGAARVLGLSVATLRAWLEAQGDLVVAADRLGVHPNTVRNRLRRMSDIVSLEVHDAGKRLAMMIDIAVHANE